MSFALLTEILTLPPVVARSSVSGGMKWIFHNRDTTLHGVAPWGDRAVRAHDNLARYAGVIGIAYITGAADAATATAGVVPFGARVLHAMIYIVGVPYLRTMAFAVAQAAMLVYVWRIIAHFVAP